MQYRRRPLPSVDDAALSLPAAVGRLSARRCGPRPGGPPLAGAQGHAAMTAAVDTAVRQPNIAVACSGLGHVQRGVEAWAADLARALRRRGVPVTLFGAAATDAPVVPLPCLKRGGRAAGVIGRFFRPLGGWRYGLGSAYEVEETTFSVSLWRRVRRQFDILHVQDPLIATLLNRLHGAGLSRPRVILANGTGESVEALAHLPVIQELTPAAAARWPARAGGPAPGPCGGVFCRAVLRRDQALSQAHRLSDPRIRRFRRLL